MPDALGFAAPDALAPVPAADDDDPAALATLLSSDANVTLVAVSAAAAEARTLVAMAVAAEVAEAATAATGEPARAADAAPDQVPVISLSLQVQSVRLGES